VQSAYAPERKRPAGANTVAARNYQELQMRKSGSGVRRFLPVVLLLSICLSNLPVHGKQPNDWGIKAGVSVSNQSYRYKTEEIERHFKDFTGVCVDIFGNTVQSDHFSMAGQLSYSQKGCIEEVSSTYVDPSSPQGYADGGKIKLRNQIDYISVAVLGRMGLDLKVFKPYLFAGPRWDFPIRTKSISSSIYDHIKDNWGYSAGFGGEFKFLWPNRMLVEFQYSPDFNGIFKSDGLTVTKTSYEVKLGFLF
jgi:hypothetical protein